MSERPGHSSAFTVEDAINIIVVGVGDASNGGNIEMVIVINRLAAAWPWGAVTVVSAVRFPTSYHMISSWVATGDLVASFLHVSLPTSLVGIVESCSAVTFAQCGVKSAGTTGPKEARALEPGGSGGAGIATAILTLSPLCHDQRSVDTCRPPSGKGEGTHAIVANTIGVVRTPIMIVHVQREVRHVAGGVASSDCTVAGVVRAVVVLTCAGPCGVG